MEIVKKHKNVLKFSLFLLTASLALTGCSNKATMPSAQQKQQNRQNQQQNVQLGVYMGDVAQDQNMLTIPVIINNTGTNKTVISSQNFTLKIDGHKFKPLQVPGETSDFHDDLASNGCWQNTVSFYVGTKLSNKLLQSVELTYLGDNGKQIKAEYIKSEEAPKQMQNANFSSYTSVPDYYSNVADYITQSIQERKNGSPARSLKDQFKDSRYDKFRLWGTASSKYPDLMILKMRNDTNTDMYLPLSDIELRDSDKNEIRVHPTYRNYSIMIPHGKTVNATVPMESDLKRDESPFQLLFRSANNSSFKTSNDTFNPAEFIFNDSKDLSDALQVEPDQYPKDSIKWKNPELSKNTVTVDAKLYDYFYIKSDLSKYRIVGLNNDGTVGDSEKPLKVTPLKITGTGSEMKFEFDDLSVIRSYKRIALQYNKKDLFKIK